MNTAKELFDKLRQSRSAKYLQRAYFKIKENIEGHSALSFVIKVFLVIGLLPALCALPLAALLMVAGFFVRFCFICIADGLCGRPRFGQINLIRFFLSMFGWLAVGAAGFMGVGLILSGLFTGSPVLLIALFFILVARGRPEVKRPRYTDSNAIKPDEIIIDVEAIE